MEKIQWELRYRSPLSPTKGVDDVLVETDAEHHAKHNGDREAAAKELADWFLANRVASPSTRFVYVRRAVVATSADMRAAAIPTAAAVEQEPAGGSSAQSASRDDSVPQAGQPGYQPPTDGGAGAATGGTSKAGAPKPVAGRVGA